LTPNKKLTDEELNYLTNNAAREVRVVVVVVVRIIISQFNLLFLWMFFSLFCVSHCEVISSFGR
jgi:hypothetical protein